MHHNVNVLDADGHMDRGVARQAQLVELDDGEGAGGDVQYREACKKRLKN